MLSGTSTTSYSPVRFFDTPYTRTLAGTPIVMYPIAVLSEHSNDTCLFFIWTEDYLAVKQENATLQETTRRLKEENRSLLMIPKTMTNWEELKGYDDVVRHVCRPKPILDRTALRTAHGKMVCLESRNHLSDYASFRRRELWQETSKCCRAMPRICA